MEVTDRDVNGIPSGNLTSLIPNLHLSTPLLNDVNLFHGIFMSEECLSRSDSGVGEEHERLEVTRVENHVSDAFPVGDIPGRLDFRMVQISNQHCAPPPAGET